MSLDDQGNLVLHTASGDVLQHAPVVYQEVGGSRQAVVGQFVLVGQNEVGFRVGVYDSAMPLVIDPVLLTLSSYLGGNADESAYGIAVDSIGSVYVTGRTSSTNFPTTLGAYSTTKGGDTDTFVTKLNATGTALVWSTYLGGNADDYPYDIAVDSAGNAYVTGGTSSHESPPPRPAPTRAHYGGGAYDAFVAKLNATGTGLIYSTYLGGNAYDLGYGIAVDASGHAYVTGWTTSANFPTTPGAYQVASFNAYDVFVSKLDAAGTALIFSTYIGGSDKQATFGQDIALDAVGNAYVTGGTYSANFPTTPGACRGTYGGLGDAFLAKLNAAGTTLVYSTYLGGSNFDTGSGIAVDSAGNAYVTGSTLSTNFPTTLGAYQGTYAGGVYDAFVAKLNAAGTALVYGTYLGGSNKDTGAGIAVDSAGNSYVSGSTSSANFPTTPGAYQGTYGGAASDAFVAEFNAAGAALVYGTYLGGSNDDKASGIAVDSTGNSYVSGSTSSTNFPTAPGAYQANCGGNSDAFVVQFQSVATPSVTSIWPLLGPASGGTTVTIYGANLGTASTATVKFGAATAAIISNTGTQIVATSPAGTAGTVDVTVTTAGGTSAISSAHRFTYTTAPIVSSVMPKAGPLAGGTTVTIYGVNLGTASTATVKFGAATAAIVSGTGSRIVAISPPASAGTVDVTVTTADGTSATSWTDTFTYVTQPSVARISPTAGPLAGGTAVTIYGENLGTATTATVKFGAATAVIVSDTGTQLVATSPAGTAGTVDVTVTTTGGTSAILSADQFTYTTVPIVSLINPAAGPLAGSTTVTITGSNLGTTSTATVTFGAATAAIVSNTGTQIVATSPAGTAGAWT